MKKILIRVGIGLAVLVVLGVILVALFLNQGIKKGVETVGPMLTKTTVKLDSVSLSVLSGSGKISGFVLGNPEGYKTPSAITVGSASLSVKPSSLLSDKIVIRSINVQAPEITFETDLKHNNLSKIVANLQEVSGGETSNPSQTEAKASKKLQVDDFVISGAKLHVSVTTLGGKSATVPLPEMRFSELGTGPEGITAAELTKKVLQEIEKKAVAAAGSVVTDLGKQASGLTKDAAGAATGTAEKATKSITDLFKKKQ